MIASLIVLSFRRSLWALGVVLAFSPLVVYLQLMPFTTWSLASERFAFVSVAGLVLVLLDLLGSMSKPKKIGGLMLVIFVPCALLVWSRIDDWGSTKTLLDHEYALQPNFHNAIRDRIGFTLLPEKRYAEAADLARQVPRAYAAEALLAYIDAERALLNMSNARSTAAVKEYAVLQQNFCSAVAKLRSARRSGYAQILHEPDESNNNILRSLDQRLKYFDGDAKSMCFDEAAGNKH